MVGRFARASPAIRFCWHLAAWPWHSGVEQSSDTRSRSLKIERYEGEREMRYLFCVPNAVGLLGPSLTEVNPWDRTVVEVNFSEIG